MILSLSCLNNKGSDSDECSTRYSAKDLFSNRGQEAGPPLQEMLSMVRHDFPQGSHFWEGAEGPRDAASQEGLLRLSAEKRRRASVDDPCRGTEMLKEYIFRPGMIFAFSR